MAIPISRRLRQTEPTGATAIGGTCSIATWSPRRTNGNIPAFFSWDTAFHLVAQAPARSRFAKEQIILLLREWYMHPNGQIPACEYDLSAT